MPTGRIYNYVGNLFPHGQNCSRHYGLEIQIWKITQLNTSNYYAEKNMWNFAELKKKLIGVHTLNFENKITLIDGLLKKSKF